MPRPRKDAKNKPDPSAKSAQGATGERSSARPCPETPALPPIPRILIVSPSRLERARLATRLGDGSVTCIQADSVSAALDATRSERCEVVIIGDGLPAGAAPELARELARRDPGAVSVLVADSPTLDQAVEAMRAGIVDIVPTRAGKDELCARVRSALAKGRQAREREDRVERLTKACRQLNQARSEVTRQVSSLCGDLAGAYSDLTDQVTLLSTATEFNSLIRQELDVESLLRTALEFVLAKTGPTNAAVFLPATSSDFSLGAYVNYDCPKDTADALLEALAGVVAPRLEHETGLRVLTSADEITAAFGESAYWLGESHLLGLSCRRDGECLAVVILFRDKRNPFPPAVLPALRMIGELFGKQLSRVIHVHHRHLPKDQWGGFGSLGDTDEENDERGRNDDDIDLAA